jgi:hypothetical protein
MSTVHHQEYLNTVYTQEVFVILVLLASASVVRQVPIACIQCSDTPDDGQWTCPKHVEYFIK